MDDNKRFRQDLAKIQTSIREFWESTYPNMTDSEKLSYWKANVERALQSQRELGEDPYLAFSPEWRREIIALEPGFDAMMDQLFEGEWAGVWDKAIYLERVKSANKG